MYIYLYLRGSLYPYLSIYLPSESAGGDDTPLSVSNVVSRHWDRLYRLATPSSAPNMIRRRLRKSWASVLMGDKNGDETLCIAGAVATHACGSRACARELGA